MSFHIEGDKTQSSSSSTISNGDAALGLPSASKNAVPSRPATASSNASDPFASPDSSRPPSIRGSHIPRSILTNSVHLPNSPLGYSSARPSTPRFRSANSVYGIIPNTPNQGVAVKRPQTRMKSHLIPEGVDIPKPWKERRARHSDRSFAYWIVYIIAFLGVAAGAVQCFFTVKNVQLDKEPLCLVMEEDFSNPDRVFGEGGTFMREVRMDGFGNGQFEMTTASQNNSFVRDGKLFITPTLTSDHIGMDAVLDKSIFNITDCTFNQTQPDNGFILHDGERSARLTTLNSASIRYGRVEVRAKMPQGYLDASKESKYGPWPMSGEIDIVEARGNGIRYTNRGSNYVHGSLNWGPANGLNGVDTTYSWWSDKRRSFGDGFHTYALEWTPKFLRIYVDSRLHTLLDLRFDRPFFSRADWPPTYWDGKTQQALTNPWPLRPRVLSDPQRCCCGTNGWFPEAQGDKPWLNNGNTPQLDFLKAIEKWYPTWGTSVEQRSMVVDYVKMWKHCKAPA
ncbi:glucan 1,3-beta-glucosidase [Coprinopsis sp. MPI-PUGE-AT-0042]|nr:glucan 1,3-beta-glucosidase [Coprinopsis sp. MPI-PUGE-AT-0042]